MWYEGAAGRRREGADIGGDVAVVPWFELMKDEGTHVPSISAGSTVLVQPSGRKERNPRAWGVKNCDGSGTSTGCHPQDPGPGCLAVVPRRLSIISRLTPGTCQASASPSPGPLTVAGPGVSHSSFLHQPRRMQPATPSAGGGSAARPLSPTKALFPPRSPTKAARP